MSEPMCCSNACRVDLSIVRPITWTPPLVGVTRDSSIFMVVDFPDPFGPMKPYTLPSGTCRLMASTTVREL